MIGIDRSNRAVERRIRACVLGAFDEQYRHLIEGLPMGDVMQIYGQIERRRTPTSSSPEPRSRSPARSPSMASDRSDRADTGSGPIIRQHPNGTVERSKNPHRQARSR